MIGYVTLTKLLYADDLAGGAFTVNGLQKVNDQVAKYCKKFSLKCNLKNSCFEKGRRLKRNRRWSIQGKNAAVVDEITYLGTTFERTGRWRKQKNHGDRKPDSHSY